MGRVTRTSTVTTLFLTSTLIASACGASMRPIPDDVEPAPRFLLVAAIHDAAVSIESEAGTRAGELPHVETTAQCVDSRHRAVHARQLAPDRWTVGRGIIELLRNDKAHVETQIDASGHVTGLLIEDVADGCFAELGFKTGDVLRTVNGQELDWSSYSMVYRSILKDGSAVVRFDRGGRPQTVVYEVRNE
jgi:hypothetical protein